MNGRRLQGKRSFFKNARSFSLYSTLLLLLVLDVSAFFMQLFSIPRIQFTFNDRNASSQQGSYEQIETQGYGKRNRPP